MSEMDVWFWATSAAADLFSPVSIPLESGEPLTDCTAFFSWKILFKLVCNGHTLRRKCSYVGIKEKLITQSVKHAFIDILIFVLYLTFLVLLMLLLYMLHHLHIFQCYSLQRITNNMHVFCHVFVNAVLYLLVAQVG